MTEQSKSKVFQYSSEDFKLDVTENIPDSKFDTLLKQQWKNASENQVFRYALDIKDWKILEGKYQLLAQMNLDRAQNRRDPQNVVSLKQPFDPEKFNFLKIPDKEICFSINENENDIFVVNVSPLEFGHSLFVPQQSEKLPQIMTKYSLHKVVEILLTSSSPNLRAIFNGLGGHASVNHLHWHFYYLNHRMPLETIKIDDFVSPVSILNNFPSKGFGITLSSIKKSDIENFVNVVYVIIEYFQRENIAHNVYLTRGKSNERLENFDQVRAFVWARKPSFGVKDVFAFYPAACELFGHLVIRSENGYQNIDEKKVSDFLENVTAGVFSGICEDVRIVLEQFLKS